MKKKGFTLLELIVVIIILGILATLGFTQYTKVVEKGRSGEAVMILGQIRTAQTAYYQEYGSYGTLANLAVEAPAVCVSTHYFSYTTTSGATFTAIANRCLTGSNGKAPGVSFANFYGVTLDNTGTWGEYRMPEEP